jgi:hypothetical protein
MKSERPQENAKEQRIGGESMRDNIFDLDIKQEKSGDVLRVCYEE